jgi:hypothetical protein
LKRLNPAKGIEAFFFDFLCSIEPGLGWILLDLALAWIAERPDISVRRLPPGTGLTPTEYARLPNS